MKGIGLFSTLIKKGLLLNGRLEQVGKFFSNHDGKMFHSCVYFIVISIGLVCRNTEMIELYDGGTGGVKFLLPLWHLLTTFEQTWETDWHFPNIERRYLLSRKFSSEVA